MRLSSGHRIMESQWDWVRMLRDTDIPMPSYSSVGRGHQFHEIIAGRRVWSTAELAGPCAIYLDDGYFVEVRLST